MWNFTSLNCFKTYRLYAFWFWKELENKKVYLTFCQPTLPLLRMSRIIWMASDVTYKFLNSNFRLFKNSKLKHSYILNRNLFQLIFLLFTFQSKSLTYNISDKLSRCLENIEDLMQVQKTDILSSLRSGLHNKCGLWKLFIWPAKTKVLFFYFVCLIEKPFEWVKTYLFWPLKIGKENLRPAMRFELCTLALNKQKVIHENFQLNNFYITFTELLLIIRLKLCYKSVK